MEDLRQFKKKKICYLRYFGPLFLMGDNIYLCSKYNCWQCVCTKFTELSSVQ